MKQTEIGLIPDDWEVKTLGEVAPLQRGFDLPLSEMTNGEYPVVFSNGINAFHNQFKVKAPGVVTGRSGTIGSLHYVEKNYWPHNTTLWVTDFHKNYPKYIFYLFQTINWKSYSGGSGVPTLNRNDVHEQKLLLPPLAEQQRIAKALSDVDALISTTEKLIQKKKNIKQGGMQNLLTGKKRLPSFAKSTEYKQTELGLIPEDWEVKELNECGYFIGGGTPDTNNLNYWKGSIPWISSSDLRKDEVRTVIPSRFITNEAIQNSATKLCPKNTILIVSRVGIGKLAISENEVCTSQDFSNFVCTEYDILYLVYQLSQILQKKADEAQGTSIKGITTDEVKLIKVVIPSKEEQTVIANVLSSMDKEIETLNTKLEKYRNLKTAMMQQLLTGKIRLR